MVVSANKKISKFHRAKFVKKKKLTGEGGAGEYPYDLGADRRQVLQGTSENQVYCPVVHFI